MRLTDTDLLKELEKPELAAVRRAFAVRRFPKGSLVFQPKEERDSIFIVKRGRVRIYLAYRDKEFTMAILDAGDVYATHTRAFVEALDELEILVADLADVRGFLHSIPGLTTAMIRVLGDLLSHAFSIIDTLAFKDVRKRLIEFLVYEARHMSACGECTDRGGCLDKTDKDRGAVSLGLNMEQLASIIGSTRQTVSSLLNALAMDGVIELKGRGVICIPDIGALEALLEQ